MPPSRSKPLATRGLCHVSKRIKEILEESGQSCLNTVCLERTTELTQMTEILVHEINENLDPTEDPCTTADKNLQRRIYDALNVLVSLGYASKSGKEVTWCVNDPTTMQVPETDTAEGLQRIIAEKQQHLDLLRDQKEVLTWVQQYAESGFIKHTCDRNLQLPFMVIAFEGAENGHVDVAADQKTCIVKIKTRECWIFDDNEIIKTIAKLRKSDAPRMPPPTIKPNPLPATPAGDRAAS